MTIIIYTEQDTYTFTDIEFNENEFIDITQYIMHREDGPAYIMLNNKNKIIESCWYNKGLKHHDSDYTWYSSIKGIKEYRWYKNNILHREDGPAIIKKHKVRGDTYNWYYNGEYISGLHKKPDHPLYRSFIKHNQKEFPAEYNIILKEEGIELFN